MTFLGVVGVVFGKDDCILGAEVQGQVVEVMAGDSVLAIAEA